MIEGRRNARREAVEQRWGMGLWELIADFAYQGLSRKQTAQAIGYHWQHFYAILRERSDADPFEEYGVVANYVRDTGEQFGAAIRRMAAAGYTFMQAQREIGYCNNGNPLRRAMRIRGIEAEFAKIVAKPKVKRARDTGMSGRYGPKQAVHPWRMDAKRDLANAQRPVPMPAPQLRS